MKKQEGVLAIERNKAPQDFFLSFLEGLTE